MKKILSILAFLILVSGIKAQDTAANKGIPPFKILKTDSTYMTAAQLKKHKPVIIIYFAPDCTHCQHFTMEMEQEMRKELKSSKTGFKNAQVVMVTFAMLQAIQVFYRDFEIAKYPNIVVGTEGYTYLVQKYYQVRSTPYIAVYDKAGKLIQGFDKVPKIEDILAALKKA